MGRQGSSFRISRIVSTYISNLYNDQVVYNRVGHCILSRSEHSGLSRSFKERSVLSHYFFEFLATLETQKNRTFFPVLFKRTEKNVKNVPFFCKEHKRMQERFVLLQKNAERSVLFSIYIYRYIYRYI